MEITIFRHAEGQRAAGERFHLTQHALVRTIADAHAVFRQQMHELAEGCFDFVNILVTIQVICIDVEHNGDVRLHFQEGTTEFAGFGQKCAAAADPRRAADGVELTADMDRGIQAALHQHLGQHGGGAGFAMGAADTNGLLIAFHQLAQQHAALDGRDTQPVRLHPFWIIAGSGAGINHQIGAMHLLRCMADIHLYAGCAHVADQIALGTVRAGHLVSLGNQHLRQTGHAGAADADHVDAFADIITDMGLLHIFNLPLMRFDSFGIIRQSIPKHQANMFSPIVSLLSALFSVDSSALPGSPQKLLATKRPMQSCTAPGLTGRIRSPDG